MALSQAATANLVAVRNTIDQKDRKQSVYPSVSVRLSKELDAAVNDIISHSDDLRSPSQVVRQALVVYHTLLTQTRMGNIGGVKMKNGEFVPLFDEPEVVQSEP